MDNKEFSEKLGLKLTLFTYQREGVLQIYKFRHHVLLADSMGLGKSAQAIAASISIKEFPIVVICPASLRYNWLKEFLAWTYLERNEICILEKRKDKIFGKVIITSYDLAASLSIEIASLRPAYIIVDESHYIKNYKAARTKKITPLCQNAKRVLLLTGTPVLNRPIELWTQLMALGKIREFGTMWDFAQKYCNLRRGRFGWDFSGSSNIPKLNQLLVSTCMVRRLKDEVLKDLPEKSRCKFYVPPIVKQTNEHLEYECMQYYLKARGNVSMALLNMRQDRVKLSQVLFAEYAMLGQYKADFAADFAIDNCSESSPLVVFGHHKSMINTCFERLLSENIPCAKIDGSTPAKERQSIVDNFQNGYLHCVVLSITAASTGLTLTRASNMLIAELPFTAGVAVQAEDRIHRIGQKNNALIRYMIAERTLDEHLWSIINKKTSLSSQILDGKDSHFAASEEVAAHADEQTGFWELIQLILSNIDSEENKKKDFSEFTGVDNAI